MSKNEIAKQYADYLDEERAELKARIDEINDEFRLYLLRNFLAGLLED